MKKIIPILIILTLILLGVTTVALPSIENNKKTIIEKICGTVLEKNKFFVSGTWAYKTPLHTSRLDAVSAVINGKIFIIGGWTPPSGSISDKVEVYDSYTDQWEEKASLPIKSVHTTCVSFNNKIYVFGGQGPRGNEYHNEVFEYDVKEDVWNRKKPMPEYRFAPYAVIVENKIYVIGGAGNQENNYVYDPINDMWDTRARMPTDRDHLGVAVVDNMIYCIGGRTYYEAIPFDIVEVYDPVLDKWEIRSPIPTPRAGFYEIGVVDGKIYVIGGEQGEPQKKTFNENEVYDPKTDTWSIETPMPIPRHGMSVSVVNGKIYCIGGGEKPFYSFGNINLVYTPNNHPPMKPNKIEGKLIGRTQTNYRYITETYDADNDQLYYFFDWGDGNNSGWFGPYDSGVEINASYSWNIKGKYIVRVKAKDVHDAESEWSDPLHIIITKNKSYNIPHILLRRNINYYFSSFF